MVYKQHRSRRVRRLLAGVLIAITLTLGSTELSRIPAADAFGTINQLGQHAEHEAITRTLSAEFISGGFQPFTLNALAGHGGIFGAVGAPDWPFDSSSLPIVGSGPSKKHCDNGDYLPVQGSYPQTREQAQANLTECFTYFSELMSAGVTSAAGLVNEKLVVDPTQAQLNTGWSTCKFSYELTDITTKCNVLNALGRALHLAEDVWSHSNIADQSDPARAMDSHNPPGLNIPFLPNMLRYPAADSFTFPDMFMTGCDDSVSACTNGRVGHSVLAKDTGIITVGLPGLPATASDKYPRGAIGKNFQAAVDGAKQQVLAIWGDFQSALKRQYGADRAAVMIKILTEDAYSGVASGQAVGKQAGAMSEDLPNFTVADVETPQEHAVTVVLWAAGAAIVATTLIVGGLWLRRRKLGANSETLSTAIMTGAGVVALTLLVTGSLLGEFTAPATHSIGQEQAALEREAAIFGLPVNLCVYNDSTEYVEITSWDLSRTNQGVGDIAPGGMRCGESGSTVRALIALSDAQVAGGKYSFLAQAENDVIGKPFVTFLEDGWRQDQIGFDHMDENQISEFSINGRNTWVKRLPDDGWKHFEFHITDPS